MSHEIRGDAFSPETIRFLAPAAPGGHLMLIDCSPRAWRVFHETYELVADRTPHSTAEWWYRGRTYVATPGVAGLIEPGEVHVSTRIFHPASITIVQVNPAFMMDAARQLGISTTPHFRSGQCSAPELTESILGFSAAVQRGATPLEQETRMTDAVRLALTFAGEAKAARQPGADRRAAALARDYLQAHALEHVTLTELAAISGTSVFHLARTFREAYGIPPHEYQNAIRVARACADLRAGTPLAEIDLGFADQSHFSRHFKRVWAVTPGRYAASLRGGH